MRSILEMLGLNWLSFKWPLHLICRACLKKVSRAEYICFPECLLIYTIMLATRLACPYIDGLKIWEVHYYECWKTLIYICFDIKATSTTKSFSTAHRTSQASVKCPNVYSYEGRNLLPANYQTKPERVATKFKAYHPAQSLQWKLWSHTWHEYILSKPWSGNKTALTYLPYPVSQNQALLFRSTGPNIWDWSNICSFTGVESMLQNKGSFNFLLSELE